MLSEVFVFLLGEPYLKPINAMRFLPRLAAIFPFQRRRNGFLFLNGLPFVPIWREVHVWRSIRSLRSSAIALRRPLESMHYHSVSQPVPAFLVWPVRCIDSGQ